MTQDKKKIAVVGAGILGVSTAEWLRRDGADVELIDRIEPGGPEQTSYGNAGVLANSSIVPVSVPGLIKKIPGMLLDSESPLFLRWRYLPRLLPWLARFLANGNERKVREIAAGLTHIVGDSVDQHLSLAKGTPAEQFINFGPYAFLYPDRSVFDKDPFAFELRRTHGFRWEERTREQLVADDPDLGEAYQFGVFMLDHGWISDPGGYVAALADEFRANGGSFWRAEVDDIKPGSSPGGQISVHANGEERHYDNVVLSAGVWSKALAERLGHRTPMESERGYHVVLKSPSLRPPVPYSLVDAKMVATPMAGGVRCAGLVEFGGTEAGPSKAPLRLIEKAARRLYPKLTWEDSESWMGHRPAPVDSLPFLGESPKAHGIYFAFGTHHIGLTSGPKIGRLTADLIAGRTPNIDMVPYRVGRFD